MYMSTQLINNNPTLNLTDCDSSNADSISDYVLQKYDMLLGVDEVVHIIIHAIDVDNYMEVNYDIS